MLNKSEETGPRIILDMFGEVSWSGEHRGGWGQLAAIGVRIGLRPRGSPRLRQSAGMGTSWSGVSREG
jgi:hypothetical protein